MSRTQGGSASTPGSGKIKWNHERRLSVWFFYNDHQDLSKAEQVRIFNSIFQENAATHTPLEAQWRERNKRPHWQPVLSASASPAEDELRQQIKAKIVAALASGHDARVSAETTQQPQDPPRALPLHRRVLSTASSAKKRLRSTLRTPSAESGSEEDLRSTRRLRKTPRTATVVIPRTPDSERRVTTVQAQSSLSRFQYRYDDQVVQHDVVSPLNSPKRTPARKQGEPRPGANMLYPRPGRTPLWLKPNEWTEALPPLVNVVEDLGKPHLPPLLFRYFDEKSHGSNDPNSPEGFICGRFKDAYVPVRPAPSCHDLEWNDVAWHLDHSPHPSPFISTSNLLVWTVQMALKSARRGARLGRISIIDTRHLSRSGCYWVPEYHKSLAKKKPFKKGGFNYVGSHEHLVWHRIPGNAILHTFSLADLLTLQGQDPAVASLLRLAEVGVGKRDGVSYQDLLKQGKLQLTDSNVRAIANVVDFLGLNQESDPGHLVYAIQEVVRGWEIKIEKGNDAQWQSQAAVFAHYYCRKSERPIDTSESVKLKTGWVNGIAWSLAAVPNVRYKPEVLDAMLRKAESKGLKDPASIIMHELQSALETANLMETERTRSLEATRALAPLKALQATRRSQALIEYAPDENGLDQERGELLTPTPTPSRPSTDVRAPRRAEPATARQRVRTTNAQLLLADGLDEDDEEFNSPPPARHRAIRSPTRPEEPSRSHRRT